jgi:hypothetical protein
MGRFDRGWSWIKAGVGQLIWTLPDIPGFIRLICTIVTIANELACDRLFESKALTTFGKSASTCVK